MTEEEWVNSTDPRAMCHFVRTAMTSWRTRWLGWMGTRRFPISPRKWRLIELAFCEQIDSYLRLSALQTLLPLARRHAEGQLVDSEVRKARSLALLWLMDLQQDRSMGRVDRIGIARLAAAAAGRLFAGEPNSDSVLQELADFVEAEEARFRDGQRSQRTHRSSDLVDVAQAQAIRDILGNPFRTQTIEPHWRLANDGAVLRLVQAIEEEGSDREMPILADALEDAGCSCEMILSHCREKTRHVRGCWVVDLILGRN